jgi:hypothetical protein
MGLAQNHDHADGANFLQISHLRWNGKIISKIRVIRG